MNKYTVLWSHAAERDLASIIGFIADDSADEALKVLRKIRSKATDLFLMPQRGRIVPGKIAKRYGIFP